MSHWFLSMRHWEKTIHRSMRTDTHHNLLRIVECSTTFFELKGVWWQRIYIAIFSASWNFRQVIFRRPFLHLRSSPTTTVLIRPANPTIACSVPCELSSSVIRRNPFPSQESLMDPVTHNCTAIKSLPVVYPRKRIISFAVIR